MLRNLKHFSLLSSRVPERNVEDQRLGSKHAPQRSFQVRRTFKPSAVTATSTVQLQELWEKMCFFIFGLFVCYLFVVSSNCHDFHFKSVHVEGFYFTSLSVSLFNILSSDPLRAPGRVGLMKTTTLMMKCKTLKTSLRGQKVMKLREHKHINHWTVSASGRKFLLYYKTKSN